ncbi:MAG: CoA transferase [Burkholderiales bacterium]
MRSRFEADVLVENYKVGGLAKVGLDRRASPPNIHGSSIARSPDSASRVRGRSARATTSSSRACPVSASRHQRARRAPGGGPQKAGIAITDLVTGLFAATGILAALSSANAPDAAGTSTRACSTRRWR